MRTARGLLVILLITAFSAGCFVFAARAISQGIGASSGGDQDGESLIGGGISDMLPFMD